MVLEPGGSDWRIIPSELDHIRRKFSSAPKSFPGRERILLGAALISSARDEQLHIVASVLR